MWILILGLVLFLGIHTILMVAPNWRLAQIVRFGDGPWKGMYSLASLAGLGLIIWGYSLAKYETEFLFVGPDWFRTAAIVLMLVAFILFVSGNLPGGRIKSTVKHPMVTSIVVWAFAHLLVNGDIASILLFGGLLVWAVWNLFDVAKRPSKSSSDTSLMYDVIAVVTGTALWAAIMIWLHPILFGVEVIA